MNQKTNIKLDWAKYYSSVTSRIMQAKLSCKHAQRFEQFQSRFLTMYLANINSCLGWIFFLNEQKKKETNIEEKVMVT